MTTASFDIRALENADLSKAIPLFIRAYREGEWNEAWSGKRAELRINQIRLSPGSIALCCIYENELVGIVLGRREIRVDDDCFFIDELAVDPLHQKKGVGRMLIDALESKLRLENYVGVFLLTLKDGSVADFYSKVGYSLGPRMGLFRKDNLENDGTQ